MGLRNKQENLEKSFLGSAIISHFLIKKKWKLEKKLELLVFVFVPKVVTLELLLLVLQQGRLLLKASAIPKSMDVIINF